MGLIPESQFFKFPFPIPWVSVPDTTGPEPTQLLLASVPRGGAQTGNPREPLCRAHRAVLPLASETVPPGVRVATDPVPGWQIGEEG